MWPFNLVKVRGPYGKREIDGCPHWQFYVWVDCAEADCNKVARFIRDRLENPNLNRFKEIDEMMEHFRTLGETNKE